MISKSQILLNFKYLERENSDQDKYDDQEILTSSDNEASNNDAKDKEINLLEPTDEEIIAKSNKIRMFKNTNINKEMLIKQEKDRIK